MRTTKSLKIDPKLWKDVKIYCAKNDIEICQYLESLIKEDKKRWKKI